MLNIIVVNYTLAFYNNLYLINIDLGDLISILLRLSAIDYTNFVKKTNKY